MIVNTPEETDGYKGLFGEVVIADCYRMKQIDFVPDIIFDLGANIGVFARYARTLFPSAMIISVEPDPENIAHFKKFTSDPNTILIEKAVGIGDVFRCLGAPDGAHECYLTKSVGYKNLSSGDGIVATTLGTIMPDDLIKTFLKPGMKSVVKMDIEGNDNTVFGHAPSMQALRSIDYLSIEVHRYAQTPDQHESVLKLADEALKSFEDTHECSCEHVIFFARKRS